MKLDKEWFEASEKALYKLFDSRTDSATIPVSDMAKLWHKVQLGQIAAHSLKSSYLFALSYFDIPSDSELMEQIERGIKALNEAEVYLREFMISHPGIDM